MPSLSIWTQGVLFVIGYLPKIEAQNVYIDKPFLNLNLQYIDGLVK